MRCQTSYSRSFVIKFLEPRIEKAIMELEKNKLYFREAIDEHEKKELDEWNSKSKWYRYWHKYRAPLLAKRESIDYSYWLYELTSGAIKFSKRIKFYNEYIDMASKVFTLAKSSKNNLTIDHEMWNFLCGVDI